MRIEKIEDPDILLRDVSLSHISSLPALFCNYGFGYSRDTLLVTFHRGVCASNVTSPTTDGRTVGRQIMDNDENIFLLDGRHRLKAMQLLQVDSDLGYNQQYIQIFLIVQDTLGQSVGLKRSR